MIEFTDGNFEQEVLNSDKLSVVDFWAEWCGPCRLITPILEALDNDYNGDVNIGKLNVDHHPETSMKYSVRSIPTILFIKNGEVVDKHVGTGTKQVFMDKIEAHK